MNEACRRNALAWLLRFGAFAIVWQTTTQGAVVVLKSGEPLVGFVTERGGRVIVSETPTPGADAPATPKTQVVEIVPTVSAERLAALVPERPDEHLAYAEELFQLRRDPEARMTAARLCAIAGRIDSGRLAAPAMRLLLELARAGRERSRVAAFGMAQGWLKAADLERALTSVDKVPRSGDPAAIGDESTAGDLLKTLRLLRQGKRTAASRAFNEAAVAQLARHADLCSPEELRAALATDRQTTSTRARLLALELAVERAAEGEPTTGPKAATFGAQLTASKTEPWRPLAWETLLNGVDPTASQFRDGQWRRP